MQFAVPQFTDVEDKLIGPLTLKQFFVVLIGGGFLFMLWSLPLPKVFFFLLGIPIALLDLGIAFGTYNGRSVISYVFPFITYILSPKNMVFSREANVTPVAMPTQITQVQKAPVAEKIEEPESRLKKLAYLLDQKTAQEEDLIGQQQTDKIKVDLN